MSEWENQLAQQFFENRINDSPLCREIQAALRTLDDQPEAQFIIVPDRVVHVSDESFVPPGSEATITSA